LFTFYLIFPGGPFDFLAVSFLFMQHLLLFSQGRMCYNKSGFRQYFFAAQPRAPQAMPCPGHGSTQRKIRLFRPVGRLL